MRSAAERMHSDFCTLFDRNYLFKGLALHESLQRHVADFTLWVLCMDDVVYEVLEKMRLPQLELLSLAQFEDEDLLRAKGTRTQVEYCWTCTPSLPLFLLDHVPGIESITYLDADLYFFSEPTGVNREMAAGSIGIVEHRLSKEYESFAENVGIYNVALMVFKNDRYARECLTWWRDRCNEWCYSRAEDGKYGDQKYLDDWPQRFERVVVLQDVGVGLAPWNVRSHKHCREKRAGARGRAAARLLPLPHVRNRGRWRALQAGGPLLQARWASDQTRVPAVHRVRQAGNGAGKTNRPCLRLRREQRTPKRALESSHDVGWRPGKSRFAPHQTARPQRIH